MSNHLQYRDYNANNPEFGEFSVDTSGPTALIGQVWEDYRTGETRDATVEFSPEMARHVGLRLIAWSGSEWAFMLSANDRFYGVNGSLVVDVVDGDPTVSVGNGPDFRIGAEYAQDLGIRLICFAGIPE